MRSAMSERAGGTTLVVLALIATLVALLLPIYWFDGNRSAAIARSGWQDDGKGTWKTEYGPVTALDRDFLRRVRTEELWELPAGRAAQDRGGRKEVRTVGEHLVDGGTELDKQALKAGRTLGVALPARSSGSQQRYLDDLKQAKGKQLDKLLVDHLRKESGTTFALISLVRDQTRNSKVRALATKANTVVLDHLTVVEDTGLVDYGSLTKPQ